jgi:ATP/maltotriose-dependent transcriptional regulator MalT
MLEGTLIGAEPAQRFVIERPRLTRLLDESQARLIVLLAPAGYGKTTLARQWLAQKGKSVVWLRADAASDDVAALAAQVAQAVESVIPGCSTSMLSRLAAATSPSEDALRLPRSC